MPRSNKIIKSVYLVILIILFFGCTDTVKNKPQNDEFYPGMILIPEGPFLMGSNKKKGIKPDEQPKHTVNLSTYYIDKFEVTNRQYNKFIIETGHPAPNIEDKDWAKPFNWTNNTCPDKLIDHPVVLVSWNDAYQYAKWAGKRLPTEAEWEKAARGRLISNTYPTGNTLKFKQASFNHGYVRDKKLVPAGSYTPNPYGLHDMAGNVWEWCQDWYSDKYYNNTLTEDPLGPDNGTYKVFRGGSWMSDIKYLRCAFRGKNVPEYKSPSLGFRCALSVEPKKQSFRTNPK